MKKEFQAIVSGRVQFVMYRDFAQRNARLLGISGTVRNLPDGTVEVLAQGHPAALETYLVRLRRGSLLSKVARVDASWREPSTVFGGFSILY